MADQGRDYARVKACARAGKGSIRYRSPEFDPHPETKQRRCLNPACRQTFLSQHNGVRFCDSCRMCLRRDDILPGSGHYHGDEVHG